MLFSIFLANINQIVFTNKSSQVKIIIIISAFIISATVTLFLYSCVINQSNLALNSLLLFFLTWAIIFFPFMIFQSYKYLRFPSSYYNKTKLESDLFYTLIGVPIFRKALINSFFRHLNRRVYLKGKKGDRFLKFIEETKQSETSHFISLMITFGFQVMLILDQHLIHFWILLCFNILFNLYPILLQRMNRFSIEKRIVINQ